MPSAGKFTTTIGSNKVFVPTNSPNEKRLSFFFDRFPRLLKRGCASQKNSRVGPDIWDNDDHDEDRDDIDWSDDLDNEMYKVYVATLGKCKRYHGRHQHQQSNLQIQMALAGVLQRTSAHKKASFDENSRLLSSVVAAATAAAFSSSGKRPATSSCRYMTMLLGTSADQVVQGVHPVRQALLRRRKSFLETMVVITPCISLESTTSLEKEERSYWSRIRRPKSNKKKKKLSAATSSTIQSPITIAEISPPATTMALCTSPSRSAASPLIAAGDDQDNVPLGLLRKKMAVALSEEGSQCSYYYYMSSIASSRG